MNSASKKCIIGIDLGTTNSLAAYVKDGSPEIIVNERGDRMTPSVVAFKDQTTVLVGELAKNQAVVNGESTVANSKISMGTDRRFHINERGYTPVECSALVLRKIKQYTQNYLGTEVGDAVITVPAYFNDNQRQATLKAGKLAGLNVLKLLNEPTAAALAYGFCNGAEEHLLVFDLGGGTLDITLMEYNGRVFRVKATGGSTAIGGINFDLRLVEHMLDAFKKQHSVDLKEDPIAYQQVVIHAERAKIDLSSVEETNIFIPYITATDRGPLHFEMKITRRQFENLIKSYRAKIRDIIMKTFEQAGLNFGWISSVVFVGGSTRIPSIKDLVVTTISKASSDGNKFNIYHDINPDEVVALGAGVLAGIIGGQVDEVEFYDITSHNLGVEDDGGNIVTIIARGASYPCEAVKLFTTTEDSQEEVTIRVVQSGVNGDESRLVSLGEFKLSNLPRARAGVPDIDVRFSIDKHGILNISATNLDTGTQKEVVISGQEWLLESDLHERRGCGLKII